MHSGDRFLLQAGWARELPRQKMVFPERIIDTLEGVGYIPPSFVKGTWL